MKQCRIKTKSELRIKTITQGALMVALSAVGAFIKIPGPLGTIAMDSCPGYLYASLAGPLGGAVVAAFGHMASAITAGFPLGVPLHLVVGAQMALCAAAYGWVGRKFDTQWSWLPAGLVAVILNGVGAPLALIPWLGTAAAITLILALTLASLANVAVAVLVLKVLNRNRADANGRRNV